MKESDATMEKEKIDRINELGRLMKERELTEEEKAEQAALRAEYLTWFRNSIRGIKTTGKPDGQA